MEGSESTLDVSLQELERTVAVLVRVPGELWSLLSAMLEEREQVELVSPTTDDEEGDAELAGPSEMVTVTTSVEEWLGPSGNVRVMTLVVSTMKVSRTVTVSVDAGPAATVTVVTDAKTGDTWEVNTGPTDASGTVIVTTPGPDSVAVPEQVELLTCELAC